MGKAVDNIKTGNFIAPGTTRDNNNSSSDLRFPPAKDPIFGYKSPFDYLNSYTYFSKVGFIIPYSSLAQEEELPERTSTSYQ
jgi:hypothetical protein